MAAAGPVAAPQFWQNAPATVCSTPHAGQKAIPNSPIYMAVFAIERIDRVIGVAMKDAPAPNGAIKN